MHWIIEVDAYSITQENCQTQFLTTDFDWGDSDLQNNRTVGGGWFTYRVVPPRSSKPVKKGRNKRIKVRDHEKVYITNIEYHEFRDSTVLLAHESRPL